MGHLRTHFNKDTFLDYCQENFNDRNWTFEKTVFKKSNEKVIITCHEIDSGTGKEHGDFQITPSHLKNGQGCPICRYIKSASSKRRSIDDIISESRKVHGDKYDYSLITEYKNDRIKYPIICHEKNSYTEEEHGIFYQTFNNHIKGKQGCPICGRTNCNVKHTKPLEYYIEKAREVHGDRFQYNSYNPQNSTLEIVCPEHGIFYQNIGNHVYNAEGCPLCGHSYSDGEKSLSQYIKSLCGEENVLENKRNILDSNRTELDIYVPSKNIAFEYNGLYWHSEECVDSNYHLRKTEECEKKGIRLFHIFEDEWVYKQDIVKSMIRNMLGMTEAKIFARKCLIKEVNSNEAKLFLDNNHLQGYCASKIKIGLYYNNELVSLMTFGSSRHFIGNKRYEWELLRFCNKLDVNVVGGASKLLKRFIKENKPKSIVSYADRRWSNGNLYDKLGFIKYNESKPNYYYIVGRKRIYRFNLRKSVLIRKYACPNEMSEHEFCLSKNWFRIYDCGCLCYKIEIA